MNYGSVGVLLTKNRSALDVIRADHYESHQKEAADSVMDSHTTGPGFKTWLARYFLPSFILSVSVEGRVLLKTLKWVAVYSSVTFHINGKHSDRSAPCLCTVTGG